MDRLASEAMTEPVTSTDDETSATGWDRLRSRMLAMLLRPKARPLGWGIVVAVGFIVAETLAVIYLTHVAPENAFGAIFLLGVLVVSAGWNIGLAVATSIASTLVYLYFHLDGVAAALFIFLPLALLANVLAGQARLRAAEAEQRRSEADALAKQQTALRRVATMVARGADPADVYPVTVAELARGLVRRTRHAGALRRGRHVHWCWPCTTRPTGRNCTSENDSRWMATACAARFGRPARRPGSTTMRP